VSCPPPPHLATKKQNKLLTKIANDSLARLFIRFVLFDRARALAPAHFIVKAQTRSCVPFGGVVSLTATTTYVTFLCSHLTTLSRLLCIDLFCPARGLLQLYAAHEPDTCVGLFRMHRPPEPLTVGDNYATFYFVFLHEPLLLQALLALCLNRWLDREAGLE